MKDTDQTSDTSEEVTAAVMALTILLMAAMVGSAALLLGRLLSWSGL